ncbi:heterogeneous nuclear ribonucleoprotein K-like isoform X1 [Convolutriloba macropyga]|uniref:heterogeneous nuclear ribonucleoprotein K-like isoform X1 n=1 Tax=Convolutriloba macropyga TaxID=536237 RepID=UPI003F526FED
MSESFSGNVKRSVEDFTSGTAPHEDETSRKKFKSEEKSFHGIDFDTEIETQLRCLMKTGDAGAIIGKGGANVRRMRDEYNLQISLPNSMSVERIMQVRGCIKNIGDCLFDCFHLIQGETASEGTEDTKVECRMLIHTPFVGGLIGYKGERIKEIRERNSSDIKIYEDCCPGSTERVFKIDGTISVVVSCVMYVLYLLELPEIKSRHNPNKPGPRRLIQYDPLNNADLNDGAFRAPPPPGPGFNFRGYSDDINYEDYRQFHGTRQPVFFEDMPGPVNTATLTVSSENAGAIIGTGGRNINVVRQRSRAEVRIEDSKDDGATRNVQITGTDSQIEYAKFLIEQFVNEDRADRGGRGSAGGSRGGGSRGSRGGRGGTSRGSYQGSRGGGRGGYQSGTGAGRGSSTSSSGGRNGDDSSGGNDFQSYQSTPPVSNSYGFASYYATPVPGAMGNQAQTQATYFTPAPGSTPATAPPVMTSMTPFAMASSGAQVTQSPYVTAQTALAGYGTVQAPPGSYNYGAPQQSMNGMSAYGGY